MRCVWGAMVDTRIWGALLLALSHSACREAEGSPAIQSSKAKAQPAATPKPPETKKKKSEASEPPEPIKHPEPTAKQLARLDAPKLRVGHVESLGKTRFVLWGAAPSGLMPKGLTHTADGKWIIASNMGLADDKTLSLYQAIPFKLEKHLDAPGKALELETSADSKTLYVSNMKEWGSLQLFSLPELELKKTVPIPGYPKLLLRDGDRLFTTLWGDDGVTKVDLAHGFEMETVRTVKGKWTKGNSKNPRGMALSADKKTLYVVNNADQTLSLFDTELMKERARLHIGYAPRHIVADKQVNYLYISMTGEDRIARFDTKENKIDRYYPVRKRPKSLAISHDDKFLYSADFIGDSLSIVDIESGETTAMKLDILKPSGLTVHPSDRFIYISGFCTNDVWAIERVPEGEHPTFPLGTDFDNSPCRECEMSFVGCPGPGNGMVIVPPP